MQHDKILSCCMFEILDSGFMRKISAMTVKMNSEIPVWSSLLEYNTSPIFISKLALEQTPVLAGKSLHIPEGSLQLRFIFRNWSVGDSTFVKASHCLTLLDSTFFAKLAPYSPFLYRHGKSGVSRHREYDITHIRFELLTKITANKHFAAFLQPSNEY